MRNLSLFSLVFPSLLLSLAGCADNLQSYYGDQGAGPTISGLDVEGEEGTIGGRTVTISGSGFGTDPAAVTVQFAEMNAEVVSVEDGAITVLSPPGPIQGGPVDVVVGTLGGQDRLDEGYTYELPIRAANQIAYVTVSNDSLSFYGGLHNPEAGEGIGYTGDGAGVEARSEAVEVPFPKHHMPYFLGKAGFASATDITPYGEWAFQSPPVQINTFDLDDSVASQRVDVGRVTLKNPALVEEEDWCANLVANSSVYYTGGDPLAVESDDPAYQGLVYPSTSVYLGGDISAPGDCENGVNREYEVDILELCEVQEYETSRTYVYESDYPVGFNFFQGESESGRLDAEIAIPIELSLEKVSEGGDEFNKEITLPEYARFEDVAGNSESSSGFLWFNRGDVADGACAEGADEDRTTSGEDAVFTWRWQPSAVVQAYEDQIADEGTVDGLKDIETYVKVTVSYFTISWLGGDGVPLTATITVPDEHNFDAESGYSQLSLPAWVLYSFPDASLDYGYQEGGFGGALEWSGWANPDFQYYGYVIITLDRITEYTFDGVSVDDPSGNEISGDLVFAYSTGDMAFFLWDNPLDSDTTCGDCLDNDGDGWTDDLDPDCTDGKAETSLYFDGNGDSLPDFTCNDGEDNDGDGAVDWEDEDCEDGETAESAECSDGDDNDGDGWEDEDDPDCVEGIFEDDPLSDEYTCNDGEDNDADGWIDGEDLACGSGLDSETDGFTGTECNDGEDNDDHGDVDSADLRCQLYGGASATLEQNLSGDCADKDDNDEDGYTDGNDPDCDRGSAESYITTDEWVNWDESLPFPCYNGADDDGDGEIDAADPGCEGAGGDPDGFADDESAAEADAECDDGLDNDGDKLSDWPDDPGCLTPLDDDEGDK